MCTLECVNSGGGGGGISLMLCFHKHNNVLPIGKSEVNLEFVFLVFKLLFTSPCSV